MGISRARGPQDAHSRDCKVGPMSVKGRAVEGRTPMQAGVIRPMANRGDSEAADRTCGELRGVSQVFRNIKINELKTRQGHTTSSLKSSSDQFILFM